MNRNTESLIGLTLGLLAGVGLALLILWAIWLFWCAVVPAFWPSAPFWLAEPAFWPFAGMWILASWVGRAVFGRRTSND